MTEKWKDEAWAQDIWYSGKVTRRTLRRLGRRRDRRDDAGAGAVARGLRRRPSRTRSAPMQPLSGAGAAGGKTALVGLQMAVDRINKNGGINGRPVEADHRRRRVQARRRPPQDREAGGRGQHRRPRRRLPVQHLPRLHAGLRGGQDRQHDQRVPRHHADHQQVQPLQLPPYDYAPAQAVAFAPYLVNKMGKKWHIAYADYSWGQSTRDAYAEEIKKNGGEVVGTTGIPLGTADMTPFLSKITGDFDGLFGIFFGKDGVTIGNQAYDLGLTKKYKWAGDGAIAESTNLPALGNKIDGFIGINRYIPVFEGAARHAVPQDVLRRGQGAAGQDRSVRPAARPLRAVELRGDERAQDRHGEVEVPGPRGHHEADRGARRPRDEGRRRLPAGRQDAPQGRPPGLPAASSSSRSRAATYTLLETVPKDKTIVPPACKFAAA